MFSSYFKVLMDMFSQEETDVSLPLEDEPIRRESLTYEDIVKDFILEENQYLHDLNMIIKVFRAPFYQHFPRSKVNNFVKVNRYIFSRGHFVKNVFASFLKKKVVCSKMKEFAPPFIWEQIHSF